MEVVLRAVLGNDRLRVTEVITQQSVPNLYGRAVRFDALATDGETIYDVEIQRSDAGAVPRRARYNSSMIDSREVSKGTLFPDLPETYVIFITEHDVWKREKPLYKVRRTFEDTEEIFDDGAHIFSTSMENIKVKARWGVSCTTSFALIRMICTATCSPSAYAFSKKTKRGLPLCAR